jgi:hypothetical protein
LSTCLRSLPGRKHLGQLSNILSLEFVLILESKSF